MGEIADMMLEGEMCEGCGVFLGGDVPGYPRRCVSCGGESQVHSVYQTGPGHMPGHRQTKRVTPCPDCGKLCRGERGLSEHRSAKHPESDNA
jgi:hypothetical protein